MFTINRMGDFSLNLFGETVFSQGRLIGTPAETPAYGSGSDSVQYLDGANLEGAVIRSRRSGDRFHPLGACGSKKLKDWFIDQKIPAELRDGIPLLAKDDEILWVMGYGISEQAKVRADSETVIKFEFMLY